MAKKYAKKQGKKKAYRKRAYKKKAYKTDTTKMVCKAPTGLADQAFVKLTLQDIGNINIDHTAVGLYDYYGNDCAYPVKGDHTNKCGYFNQWASMYTYCVVYGSKIEVMVVDVTPVSSANPGIFLGVYPSTGSEANPTYAEQVMVQPRAKYQYIQRGSGSPKKINMYCTTHQIFGVPKRNVDIDEDYVHQMADSSEPHNPWFWKVFVNSADQNISDVSIILSVKLTYYCRLFQKVLATGGNPPPG